MRELLKICYPFFHAVLHLLKKFTLTEFALLDQSPYHECITCMMASIKFQLAPMGFLALGLHMLDPPLLPASTPAVATTFCLQRPRAEHAPHFDQIS